MISVPVAVHNDLFEWQLDLFWFNHKLTYGDAAAQKARAIVVKRNTIDEPKRETMAWNLDMPHVMCESFFDYAHRTERTDRLHVPLNIQTGLAQIIGAFQEEQVIEVLDCDMFHFRKHPQISVRDDELVVCDYYEDWHLKSLTEHKGVIQRYFKNGGGYYNGGFVPIIGKVGTFKRILSEWTAIHEDILANDWSDDLKWWAGMYALQAACERAQVVMSAKDYCYISDISPLSSEQYVGHYACDRRFDKKKYPHVRVSDFGDNEFYGRLRLWPRLAGAPARETPSRRSRDAPLRKTDSGDAGHPDRDHADVLQLIVQARCPERYLEIGGATHRTNFDRIDCRVKHWVDPSSASPPTEQGDGFRVSSDAFFADPAKRTAETPGYDLIFVDGPHYAEQVKKNISHAMRWCGPRGAIIVRDCWPGQADQGAREPHSAAWAGDVWKAMIQIAEENPQLDFRTWPGDGGVCVIRSAPEHSPLLPYRPRDYYTWDFYLAYRRQLLREADWQELWRWCFSAQ